MTTHSTRADSRRIALGAAALVFILALCAPPARAAEPCPQALRFDADGPATDIDPGWTGMAHDNHFVGLTLTMGISGCPGTPPCGTCALSGPVASGGGATFNNRRCVDKTWLTCVDDADCVSQGAAGPCHVFFGPPLPYSAGGVSVCVINEITGALTGGSTNVEAGTVAMTLPYRARIYSGPTADHPCPLCIAGSCDSGPRINESCTTSGTSPVFGDVSFDCPPEPLGVIGDLVPSGLALSTSDQTMTLGAASPSCRATGFTGLKCFCDSCNSANAEACSSNADCPDPPGPIGPICGGKRCVGGSNNGAACATSSECPSGGSCVAPGRATQPNECDDTICSPNTPPDNDSTNEGACSTMGPFELFCAIETFRSCFMNADCIMKPGDSCTLGKWRECFTDNGVIGTYCFGGTNNTAPCSAASECPAGFCGGGSIEAGGVANPPVGNTADATLGSLFCIPPTSSSAVNSVGGFPGPGRFTLPGTLTFADEMVSGTVGAGGGSVTTDTEADGATPADPFETAVTTPNPGEVIINEQADSGSPPAGFSLLGKRVNITAPPALASDPLVLVFRIDASRTAGENENSIQIFKDGGLLPIENCLGATVITTDDPCVSGRALLGDGDIQLTILTTSASIWNFGVAQAPPGGANKCLAGKTKCVNKKMAGLLKCHEKAEKKGMPFDFACLAKVVAKFDGGTKGFANSCFGKLEAKNDGPCFTFGDLAAQEAKVDAFVIDVVQELDPFYPFPTLNKCSAGKKKCVNKKAAGLLKCRAKCQKDPAKCGVVETECRNKAIAKFDGGTKGFAGSCFGKLEAEGGCPTVGDMAALEAKVDAFVADVLSELETP